MKWSLIILGLITLTSVAYAKNSYLVILPNLFKVEYDNQISILIAHGIEPVEIKFVLTINKHRIENKIICKSGETQNGTLSLPNEFPVGAGELIIIGSGGLQFEERRDVIIYDNRHALLIQTSASTYRPRDTMEIRVIATNENLIPIENGELTLEIYDAALKLVGEYPHIPIRSGLSEKILYPIGEHINVGTWAVSAIIGNTTSSIEVLVSHPITPSFDIKAIFQRYLLRTDKFLHGSIQINNDENEPIFGRGRIYIGQITEQDIESNMKTLSKEKKSSKVEEWRQWKSQQIEIAGRLQLNYDLLSLFNIDVSQILAIEIYIQITDLVSGQERIVRHIIPIFTRDVIYDIRPLEFQANSINEFEIIAKRPDGKPIKMENMIVTVKMILGNQQGKTQNEQSIEIKDFYTRGRNDIGFFNIEIPENCIGVLMTITPLDESGKVRGYRTHAIPLMPTPRRHGAKLSIELLPSRIAPTNTNVNVPVVSTQISTVGRTSNFYIQLIPLKSIEKIERLTMSYVIMTNGRITLTGQFNIHPTKECQIKTRRTIHNEEITMSSTCIFNGTLPIEITHDMIPYSSLIVYTFQPTFQFYVAESYRFSVAGLFQNSLSLNATIVPFTPKETTTIDYPQFMKELNVRPVEISDKVQDKTRVELSFTGAPDSIVGLNVIEYNSILQGLSNDITKERLLKYLTRYEQVPIVNIPTKREEDKNNKLDRRTISEDDEKELINRERMGYQIQYPVKQLVFGIDSSNILPSVEGDDIYRTSNMERLYTDMKQSRSSHYRRKLEKSTSQYDVTVDNNDYVIATSIPLDFTAKPSSWDDMELKRKEESLYENHSGYGTPTWYEKLNNKLNNLSQEAFTFMQSGLTFISDFESLNVPMNIKHEKLIELFSKFRQQSMINLESFSIRDQGRLLLEEYISQSDLSLVPPPIILEEQSRTGYYRSIYFNTTRIESQGIGKVILPQTKPFSTWLATAFALNNKSGLSIAQPIRLPTNHGLFILANFPRHIQMNEHVLLTYSINNYLGKDINNVIVRIRTSNDFDLIEENKSEKTILTNEKDYRLTIPSMKNNAVETYQMIIVPKHIGFIQIIIEVESELGGDYEILTVFVRESAIERTHISGRLFDLTNEKKSYGPIIQNINQTSNLRALYLSVSGTGLDYLVRQCVPEMKTLVGIDRALIRLYRSLGLLQYLNGTSQRYSLLYNMTVNNITTAYQKLQLYNDYDGSYSFISDEGKRYSSLYLTSLSFGAMISPMMPYHDNVTLNRTLNWILSHQEQDGSFNDNSPCFHYRFCSNEFRRESLTAIILYSLTHDNASFYMPQFIYQRLFNGDNSPIMRAQRYLISRVPSVKPHYLIITLFEMAFIQNPQITSVLREKIREALLSRQLTVVSENDSKYIKSIEMTSDDQLLLNAMTASLYSYYEDHKTATQIANWLVHQIETHPYYDGILDAIFHTDAWIRVQYLLHQKFNLDNFDVTVNVTIDNREKKQFKITSQTMDLTQLFRFTLPVDQITYSVHGSGVAGVFFYQVLGEQQQQQLEQRSTPFELTQEFTSMPLINEIKAKTCVTYTPSINDLKLIKSDVNRTILVKVELPSGTRINLRQLGFSLSNIREVIYFTYDQSSNKLIFFINIPSTIYGKPICFQWGLERLSSVMNWSPIEVRVSDYLQQDNSLVRLIPIEFQPRLIGYPFIEAMHNVTPAL